MWSPMLVIHGFRELGKVDEVHGQYGATLFFHLFWLPIAPCRSIWVLDHNTSADHPTRLNGRSIAAAYARWWGAVVGACAVTAIPDIAFGLLGVAAFAIAASSFWWGRASSSARRRSDANLAAFKTRCEPGLLPDDTVAELRAATSRRWAELSGGRTPSDIARFGASDPQQATLAYAQLRLAALALEGSARLEAEADAWRILEDVRELPTVADPYRAGRLRGTASALPCSVAADPARAPAPSSAIDEAAARVSQRLARALDGFTPCEIPTLGLAIDLILRRGGPFKAAVVVVLRVPDTYGGIGMGTPAIARAITDHVGRGAVVIVYVGSELGPRLERLEAGLFEEEIAVRGVFAIDVASGTIASAIAEHPKTRHLVQTVANALV